jgi:CRP/FNR family transcriptional regulator, cyclic AMP receptor protein
MGIFSEEPLLAALDTVEREALLRAGTSRIYQQGQRIMRQGDRENFVVAITAGWTVVGADSDNGRSVIFGLCGPMDLIGELAAFDGGPRSATVTALTEVRARWLRSDELRTYLSENPRSYDAVLRGMALRLRAADDQNQELATLPVLRRLARLLLDLDGSHPRAVPAHRLTQQELAAAIGATRESVAKALADLRARNILRTGDRQITVLDRQALTAIASL